MSTCRKYSYTFICLSCGASVEAIQWGSRKSRQFCSKRCASAQVSPEERFWSKVNKSDGCWLWSNIPITQYGKFHATPNHRVHAHRFSYELAYGPILDGLSVLHRCDTPACVRPDHLFLGTDKDNVTDMYQKGRNRNDPCKGERQWKHTLTTEQVIQIRERYHAGMPQNLIAKEYDVRAQTVWQIVHRYSWKHIP